MEAHGVHLFSGRATERELIQKVKIHFVHLYTPRLSLASATALKTNDVLVHPVMRHADEVPEIDRWPKGQHG
jgi:hypothetical protein